MAWSFNGSTQYMAAITGSPGLDSDYTICCWINQSQSSEGAATVWAVGTDADNYDRLYTDGNNLLNFQRVRGGTQQALCTGSTGHTNGTWMHVACIMDLKEGQLVLYVDGQLDGVVARGGGTDPGQLAIYIGSILATDFFAGAVDCFIITQERDPTLVPQLMRTRNPYWIQNPLHWWDPLPGISGALQIDKGTATQVTLGNTGSVIAVDGPPIPIVDDGDDIEHVVSSHSITLGTSVLFALESDTIGLALIGLTAGPVSVALLPVQADLFAVTPTIEAGPVTIVLPPVETSIAATEPAVVAGAVSIGLQPVLGRFPMDPPAIVSGGVTVFLTPAIMRLVLPDVDILVGDNIGLAPVVATFGSPNIALSHQASVLIAPPIVVTSTVTEVEIIGSQQADIDLLPVVALFGVPFPGQRSNVQINPAAARFVIPPIRIIGIVTLRDRIACVLVDEARAGEFYAVSHNPNTGCSSTQLQTAVQSIETLTNETDANFGIAKRHRRTFRDERRTWTWRLVLGFAEEVTIERFEDDLVRRPRVIPRDLSLGFPQVTLRLRQTLYDHPVQQDSNRGTRAILTFDAELAPV